MVLSDYSGHYAAVAVRDNHWRRAVAALACATAAPLIFAAAVLMLSSSGLERVFLLVLAIVGLLAVLPFWPPVLRGDADKVSEMIDRRRSP